MTPRYTSAPEPCPTTELSGRVEFATRDVLAIAYACARTYGWVPASQDGSTKALVLQALRGASAEAGEVLAEITPHLQQGLDLVEDMIQAGRAGTQTSRGYASDLEEALAREVTPPADVGLVCSAVAGFVRDPEQEAPAQVRVGEQVTQPATVRTAVQAEGTSSGRSMLVVFDTERGAMRVTTPAHWARQLAVGDQVVVEGVVSGLELFRGRRRAILTRVRVCGS